MLSYQCYIVDGWASSPVAQRYTILPAKKGWTWKRFGRRFHYRGVLGRRCGLVDALDAFLDPLLGAAVVRVEELAQDTVALSTKVSRDFKSRNESRNVMLFFRLTRNS